MIQLLDSSHVRSCLTQISWRPRTISAHCAVRRQNLSSIDTSTTTERQTRPLTHVVYRTCISDAMEKSLIAMLDRTCNGGPTYERSITTRLDPRLSLCPCTGTMLAMPSLSPNSKTHFLLVCPPMFDGIDGGAIIVEGDVVDAWAFSLSPLVGTVEPGELSGRV